MSTQEAILVVIFAAIVVNLVIAVWLLLGSRLRARRRIGAARKKRSTSLG